MQPPVVIYSARSRYWARVFEAALRMEGIAGELVAPEGARPPGRVVDVVVDHRDAERARRLAEEFERYQMTMAGDGPSDRALRDAGRTTADGDVVIGQAALVDMLEAVRLAAVGRPQCPECGRARLAVCPICQTSSSEMPQGDPRYSGRPYSELLAGEQGDGPDRPAGSSEGASLLICPTCDEPFEERYLRECEWCGHDFGSGIESAASKLTRPIEVNVRAVALVIGLILGTLAALVYFAYL
ncbi:MAG: hypothetical protein KDA63_01520 [Planctomycetales bacterium]|nr:hypothetical protein [Planctomycetales bacterium]